MPWLEPGQGVFPDDLEEAERRQGVRVRSGDAVLLRTGYGRARHEAGEASGFTQAGWHASCLPWLHERDVALIGADTPQDVQPSGYEDVLMPVHAVSLVAMGLWLLDNCDLEVCATTAAELGQWDFHLAVAPVASPVRPAARSTRSPHSDGGSRGGAMPSTARPAPGTRPWSVRTRRADREPGGTSVSRRARRRPRRGAAATIPSRGPECRPRTTLTPLPGKAGDAFGGHRGSAVPAGGDGVRRVAAIVHELDRGLGYGPCIAPVLQRD